MNHPTEPQNLILRFPKVVLLLVALLLGTVGCREQTRTENKLAKDINAVQDLDSKLTLSDVTLEQADERGQLLWRVKSKQATYSKDQKIVHLQAPKGGLFQDGKEVYQIEAKTGLVNQDGNQIFLKGDIVATDPRNGVVLRGNELDWKPKEDILIVRNNLTGEHKQITASAKEARVFSRAKRMELYGQVVANMKDPVMQLRTDELIWLLAQEKAIANHPTQIDKFQGKQVTDRAFADQADVDLKLKIINLTKNAQLLPSDPPLQIDSQLMSWNLPAKMVVSPGRVTVLHRVEKVTMTGDRGRGDLQQSIFYLTGNVLGVGQKRTSQVNSDQLTWYFKKQTFDAVGNVVYRQLNPLFNLIGPKASGQLKDQTVVVQGNGSGGQVVTEIVPEEQKKLQ